MQRKGLRRKLVLVLTIILAPLAVVVLFVAYTNWAVTSSAKKYIYRSIDPIPPQKIALVLGAGIRGPNRLSAMLEDRVLAAIDLYKSGKVEKLLMTGDNSATNYDEVSAMRRYALKHDVPVDDILRDFAGFRTYDSMYRARELWGLKSMVVVTQEFHLARSVYTARKLGIDAVGLVADRQAYWSISLRKSRLREIAARTVAWIQVNITKPKPKFLGPPQTLSGEAQTREVEGTNP
jgi:SanA protein